MRTHFHRWNSLTRGPAKGMFVCTRAPPWERQRPAGKSLAQLASGTLALPGTGGSRVFWVLGAITSAHSHGIISPARSLVDGVPIKSAESSNTDLGTAPNENFPCTDEFRVKTAETFVIAPGAQDGKIRPRDKSQLPIASIISLAVSMRFVPTGWFTFKKCHLNVTKYVFSNLSIVSNFINRAAISGSFFRRKVQRHS